MLSTGLYNELRDYRTDATFITGALLRNFLEALSLTGAEKSLKRVLIPGGGKQYGLHLGPAKQPCEEDDRRIDGPERPPNFYYLQQDILKDYSAGKCWDWVRVDSSFVNKNSDSIFRW